MTSKVLGFKKDNAIILSRIKGMGIMIPRVVGKDKFKEPICVYLEESDFVPVVSLEWIEKYILSRLGWLDNCVKKNSKEHLYRSIELRDLLKDAKKEANK